MAEYIVNTNQLRNNADQFISLARELDTVALRLAGMQLGSIVRIKASTALIGKVNDCRRAAANQADDLQSLRRCLMDLAEIYESYEKKLTEPKTQEQADAQQQAEFEEWLDNILDDIIDAIVGILGEGCGAFGIISSLFGLGGDNLADLFKNIFSGAANILNNLGEGVGEAGAGADDWMKAIFNVQASDGGTFASSFNKWWDSVDPTQQTNTVGKAGVICQWAGYALSFLSSGIENYDEAGGNMNARFWRETFLEGAVDVGLGIGAGIIAGAVLSASTPAIVVGAVGALAVWGLNAAFDFAFGMDIAEGISTLVFGEDKASETAEPGWKEICDWASYAW